MISKAIRTVKDLQEALKKCKPSDEIGIREIINRRGDSHYMTIYKLEWNEAWKNWELRTGEGARS